MSQKCNKRHSKWKRPPTEAASELCSRPERQLRLPLLLFRVKGFFLRIWFGDEGLDPVNRQLIIQ
jgi:hypothetical protein